MQTSPLLAAAASAALIALAGCSNQPETVNSHVDTQAEALKNAPPVELPPSVTASKTYRCADNSLFFVEFYSNATAMLHRGSRDAPAIRLTTEGGSPPFTGSGNSVSGTGDTVTINGRSCHT